MKKLRLPRSMTVNGIFVFVALFCVTSFAMLEQTSISIPLFSSVKMPLVYVGAFCLLTQIKPIICSLPKKSRFFTLLLLLLVCVLLVVSMFANRDSVYINSVLRRTVRLMLYLIELFLLMIVIAETGRREQTLKFLFWYVLVLTIINDTLMFTRIVTFQDGRYEGFLVGTKFSVCYLHFNLSVLWMMTKNSTLRKENDSRWKVIAATVATVLISVRVDCMTGVMGSLFLMVLILLMKSPRVSRIIRFTSPYVFLAGVVASVVLAYAAEAITELPLMRYVVEEVLNRETSLTGRTRIYDMYAANLEGKWLTGYGYGSGNVMSNVLFGYECMQNGLLQWVLEVGVPATASLVLLMMKGFQLLNRAHIEKRLCAKPLVALVYMYIILATTEPTYNMAFMLFIALLFMIATEKKVPAKGRQSMKEESVATQSISRMAIKT